MKNAKVAKIVYQSLRNWRQISENPALAVVNPGCCKLSFGCGELGCIGVGIGCCKPGFGCGELGCCEPSVMSPLGWDREASRRRTFSPGYRARRQFGGR